MSLPLDDAWPEIKSALGQHRNLVLVAEPGAGKTTRLPVYLRQILKSGSMLAVLEPRRIAARAAAARIADENSWRLGDEVGYSVRFDHKLRPTTAIRFYTEGLFLRKLAEDRELRGFDCIVLDEFHERSRYTDLALAVLKEVQALERPDLRIVVMSATIDAGRIAQFLAIDDRPAPIVDVPGRTYPVDVMHQSEPLMLATGPEWTARVSKLVADVIEGRKRRAGDVLVFLPGTGEIRRLGEALPRSVDIAQLHGGLTLEEQAHVLTSHRPDETRVILATNIAETSLTLNGVGTVIDTGLARVARSDRLGFSHLQLERISLASVKQRGGRAGRQGPGLNYRMWSKLDENSFPPFIEAELERTDLTDSLLDLYAMGIVDPRSLDWFERPEPHRLAEALAVLKDLGALDASDRLSARGKAMVQTGLPARAARMKIEASFEPLNSLLASILTERDFLQEARANDGYECDLHRRADFILGEASGTAGKIDRGALATMKRVYQSLTERSAGGKPWPRGEWPTDAVASLLLLGFPDRLCRRRKPLEPRARMVGGKGVELHPNSAVKQSEFFFALKGDAGISKQSRDPLTTLASGIEKQRLRSLFGADQNKQTRTVFDAELLTAYRETGLYYRDLPLDQGSRDKADPNDALPILVSEALLRRPALLAHPPLVDFLQRLDFLRRSGLAIDLAAIEGPALDAALGENLFGKTSIRPLLEGDESEIQSLLGAWERHISASDPELIRRLALDAPRSFQAPTGNRFPIHYSAANDRPYVEVRLQELFGLAAHPTLASGKVPLTLHLLGPNYRPVQVTSDIAGFWKGSYFEVRKELRARYPKHAWPEDPANAKPEAKGSRRR